MPNCNCKSNSICRVGYVRKSYKKKNGTVVKAVVVAPKCIKDKGKPGKGPKILPKILKGKEGSLVRLGYSIDENQGIRKVALKKAVNAYGLGTVIKKINYIRILNKSNKTKYNKLTKDIEYLQKMKVKRS
tara:strand:- start:59 stop:448 length:390 start_codon:yes stop_codon:yes gene_type:complete